MEKTPTGEVYWVLYEGIPGGSYDTNRLQQKFWGTDKDGRRTDTPPLGKQTSAIGRWSWVYWGDQSAKRVLFLQRRNADGQNDLMAYMNAKQTPTDGMIVFGFGRGPNTESQLRLPNTFTLGFAESIAHDHIAEHIQEVSRQAK